MLDTLDTMATVHPALGETGKLRPGARVRYHGTIESAHGVYRAPL